MLFIEDVPNQNVVKILIFNLFGIDWEFCSIAVDELILTTILNITAVTVIAFIFIPHFSAALFILPLIISVNINLLGKFHTLNLGNLG